jgi:hypothetical protein
MPFRRRNPRVNSRIRRKQKGAVRPPMAGPKFLTMLLLGAGVLTHAGPAAAQFGTIFGDSPRPPANVPGRQPYPPYPAPSATESRAAAPAPGAIESQPLPPPGTEAVPGAVRGAPPPGTPPGQRALRATSPPATTAPQPGDEVITALPAEKIVNPTAIFSGLDKITGRIITFDVAINETVQFGALQVTPRACYTRPPTETPNTDGFVEVDEITLKGETRRIFTGWMFAASPGLHGVEHPIYDVWLVDCRRDAPNLAAGAAASSAPANATPPAVNPPPTPAPPAKPAAPTQTQTPSPAIQRR